MEEHQTDIDPEFYFFKPKIFLISKSVKIDKIC